MAIVTGLTIEEFEQLPDRLAHNHELIKGELVDVSGNIGNHNRLRDLLVRLMGSYVDEHKLGYIISEQEYDFDGDAYGPDISFFGPEKRKLYNGQLRVQRFVPDLVIEIASRGERLETPDGKDRDLPELRRKRGVYLLHPDPPGISLFPNGRQQFERRARNSVRSRLPASPSASPTCLR